MAKKSKTKGAGAQDKAAVSTSSFGEKLKNYSVRKKVKFLVISVCALSALIVCLSAFVISAVMTSNSLNAAKALGNRAVAESQNSLSEQSKVLLDEIAVEQARICAELFGDTEDYMDNLPDVLAFISAKSVGFTFILEIDSGEYIAHPDGNFDAKSVEDFIGAYKEKKIKRITNPVTGKSEEVYVAFSEIKLAGAEYALGVAMTKSEMISEYGELAEKIKAGMIETDKEIKDISNMLTVILLGVSAGLSVAVIVLLVKNLNKMVSIPLSGLVFDIKNKTEGIDEIKISKETNNELLILESALFQLIDSLKENMEDVLQLSGLTEKFENSANFDMLTGVFNRRRFYELVQQHAVIAARKNAPTFVIMLDLDHFKRVNDTYGHAAGDEVLKTIAGRIKDTVRPSDLFGRYGGEEFIMFISVSDTSNANTFAERIRLNIESAPVVFEDISIPVTASMGLAQVAPDTDFDTAQKNADAALYKAKENGRNRVEIYSEENFKQADEEQSEGEA
ncbi:MAG: diguanylate cyclase [Oscillospiraceae bacterium]|jgi:diguanylate cyclase (GGDEF)-like protein|nr:diguanylate cyclase [Oscillospiraceae bacterium]